MPLNIKKCLVGCLFLILILQNSVGQSLSNLTVKSIDIQADTLILDSLSLLGESFYIEGVDTSDYELDAINGRLIIKNKSLLGKTYTCSYRTYPFRLNKPYTHKDTNSIEKNLYDPINPLMLIEEKTSDILSLSDESLTSSGSLSRGITIGNNQDLALNSNLNLQLSGNLSEDVSILANITDKNIPIQPEGNSRQIQEFDKIFIQLKYKEKVSLLAGDIEDNNMPETYFMRFTKKGQGLIGDAFLQSTTKKGDTLNYRVKISGAIAKGTFNRQYINAIEGNQGPYRLHGANNESNIIVLSGSERIYIDGKRLERGDDADYVIDYNAGELTFTARQLITKDKRIVAEFEYSDLNYVRGFTHINTSAQHKRWNISFNFYDEEDFKNQSNQLDLNSHHVAFLQTIGNQLDKAYFPYIDSLSYSSDEVRYKMVDTLIHGVRYDSVFVQSTNKDSAYYRLGFTLVGEGNGNYVLAKSAVNGKVHVWIAPINGIPQGNYEPIMLLITPKRTQMYDLKMNYELTKNTFVNIETALSNNDLNTFSSIGNSQNVGFAMRFMLENTVDLQKRKNKGKDVVWKMHNVLNYETKNKLFDPIENYRDVEFVRNYNLTDSLLDAAEHFANAQIGFYRKNYGRIQWNSHVFFIPTHSWNAHRHNFVTDMKINTYKLFVDASALQTTSPEYTSVFVKHKEIVSKEFRYFEIGVREEMEYNELRDQVANVLLSSSYAFNEAGIFLKNNDSLHKSFAYHISYDNRIDKNVFHRSLDISSIAHEIKAGADFLKFANHPLRLTASYRNLTYKDSLATTQIPENTLLTNADYQGRFLKGAIQVGVFYELGSGMEQKNAYSYLKVADGQGVYQWIDYNQNGIEELDEFEVAMYKDQANYIRVWMVSNEYIKTYNNSLTQSIALRPMSVWGNKTGFKKFMARFANITTYQTQLKQKNHNFMDIINPFYKNINDTNLVNTFMLFRNAFSFNQHSTLWGLDAIYNKNKNKILMVNGFESTDKEDWQLSGRIRFLKNYMFTLNYYYANYLKLSEYFTSRNFNINAYKVEPVFSFQHHNKLTINLVYYYGEKYNRLHIEKSFTHKVSTDINIRMPKNAIIYMQLSYYHIDFKGEANGSVAYEMLEALQPGHNGVFNVSYQTNLFKNLQLNLLYDGRVSPNTPMIHTGSVEVRAFF